MFPRASTIRLFAVLALAIPSGLAQSPGAVGSAPYSRPRSWTIQGNAVEGGLQGIDPISGDLWILTRDGIRSRVVRRDLAPGDLEWLKSAGQTHASRPIDAPDPFYKPALSNRESFPIISQSDYAGGGGNCFPSSFCNFLLWWDQANLLPIPHKGDFDEKAEWIHKRIERHFDTRTNSGTSFTNAIEGISRYFNEDLKEVATFRITRVKDIDPAVMSRYVTGSNACLLSITTHKAGRHNSTHAVALTELTPDGKITFVTWGAKFKGRLKPAQPGRNRDQAYSSPKPGVFYDIELLDKDSLPERYRVEPPEFSLELSMGNQMLVVTPYRFATEGKRALPPPDAILDDNSAVVLPTTLGLPPNSRTLPSPVFPIPFSQPYDGTTVWPLPDGRRVPVKIVDLGLDGATLITASKTRVPVKYGTATEPQKLSLTFRQGLEGTPLSSNNYRLVYGLLLPQSDRSFRFVIEGDGKHLRVSNPATGEFVVVDGATGAYRQSRQTGERTLMTMGRFSDLEFDISRACRADSASFERFFRHLSEQSSSSGNCKWPSRALNGLLDTQGGLASYPMDFTLLHCPYAMSALRMALTRSDAPAFLPTEARVEKATEWLGRCEATRILPLKVTFGARPESDALRLELIDAQFEVTFPADHFQIPAKAQSLQPGEGLPST